MEKFRSFLSEENLNEGTKQLKEASFENDISNWVTMWFAYLNNEKALELFKKTDGDVFYTYQNATSNKTKAKKSIENFIELRKDLKNTVLNKRI